MLTQLLFMYIRAFAVYTYIGKLFVVYGCILCTTAFVKVDEKLPEIQYIN